MMVSMQQDELAEFDVTEDAFDAMLADSEPVQVAGPFDQLRQVRFELVSGSLRTYRWRLVGANGEILATSAASYRSSGDARRALEALTVAVQHAPIVDLDEADGPAPQRKAS